MPVVAVARMQKPAWVASVLAAGDVRACAGWAEWLELAGLW